MRWLPTISFSSSTGSSSSSSAKSSPARASPGSDDNVGVRTWRFGSRGKAAARHRKQLRHFGDREIAVSASGIPRLSEGQVNYRCASGYDNLPARLGVPQPLPLPEISTDFRRKDCPASGSGGSGYSPLLRSPKFDRADVGDDTSAAGGGIRSIFSIRGTGGGTAADPGPKGRPNHGSFQKFRVEVPTRSLPASPFESPALSPQRPGYDLVPYYLYMVPSGNQVWSAPEMVTTDMMLGTPPPAFLDCSPFSTDCSPVNSPPGRSIHQFCRTTNESPSPLPARVSMEITSSRREGMLHVEVHPLPLPPGASPSSPVTQAVEKSEPVLMKSQWQKGKLIGRGTFGSVYVASNRETGALCAMKEVELLPDDPKSAECIKQLQQEINVLSQLKHQNIVQYYGSEILEDRFYIYLEYVHPGSINKYVRDHYGAITESVVRNFTRHILSGLAYLHSTMTIHRDIKGANLLVDSCGVVKLADFGMAKHLTGQAADLSLKGSPYWMAPELMQAVMQKDNSSELALAVDIWSLGCTVIEMLTGKPPWGEFEGAAAMFKVLKDSPPIPETLSSEGKDFLQCCFRRNPAERPSAPVLLEHRFLKNLPPLEVSTQTFSTMNLTDKSLSPTTDRPVYSPKSPTATFQGKFASER